MKKVIFVFTVSICGATLHTNAQLRDTALNVTTQLDASSFLLKSKKQKTAAWILLAGGGGLASAGLIIATVQVSKDLNNIFNSDYKSSNAAGEIMFYSGAAAMLGSIPLFIASGKNKRKATLMLKKETVSLKPHVNSIEHIVSLGIKLNL